MTCVSFYLSATCPSPRNTFSVVGGQRLIHFPPHAQSMPCCSERLSLLPEEQNGSAQLLRRLSLSVTANLWQIGTGSRHQLLPHERHPTGPHKVSWTYRVGRGGWTLPRTFSRLRPSTCTWAAVHLLSPSIDQLIHWGFPFQQIIYRESFSSLSTQHLSAESSLPPCTIFYWKLQRRFTPSIIIILVQRHMTLAIA